MRKPADEKKPMTLSQRAQVYVGRKPHEERCTCEECWKWSAAWFEKFGELLGERDAKAEAMPAQWKLAHEMGKRIGHSSAVE